MAAPAPITEWIARFDAAGRAIGFTIEHFGQVGTWPLLGMTRGPARADQPARRIYLSAGIHGDEPAPPQALLELLENDALPRTHHYCICPLLNPTGLATGTRENAQGIDLNRDYRDFLAAETRLHAEWIQPHVQALDCACLLHEDWESKGFYLYELNFTDRPGYAERILASAGQHLPIESADQIDGSAARDGIIRHETLPEIEEGEPEAIYLHKTYGGLNYTLETPSAQPLPLRIKALTAAVRALL